MSFSQNRRSGISCTTTKKLTQEEQNSSDSFTKVSFIKKRIVFLVLQLQRANKMRNVSIKNRKTFMAYYWENLKVDIAKVLLQNGESTPILAKNVSYKIFSLTDEARDLFIEKYYDYCKQVFFYKFILWRI